MRRWFMTTIALVIILVPAVTHAQEPAGDVSKGVIEGKVVNQTEDGLGLGGIDVCLITVAEVEVEKKTVRTDEDGSFRFDGLMTDSRYLVHVSFEDIDYYYPVDFTVAPPTGPIEIPVCSTTEDDGAISIEWRHIVLQMEDGNLTVTDVIWLVNEGDHTYIGSETTNFGGKQGTLVFTLPEGATDFSVPDYTAEDYFLIDNNTVIHTLVFPPGEQQLVYSYQLSETGPGETSIELLIDYPTSALDVMVAMEDVEVTSTRLNPAEPVETEDGKQYIHFTANTLSRGETVDIRLINVAGQNSGMLIVLCVAVSVVLLCLAVYLLRKIRAKNMAPVTATSRKDTSDVERQVRDDMARLDRDYEQGFMDEATYRKRYAAKAAELAGIRKPGNAESPDE